MSASVLYNYHVELGFGLLKLGLPEVELIAAGICVAGLIFWIALRQPLWILYAFVFLQLTRLDHFLPDMEPLSPSLALELVLAGALMFHWFATGSPLRTAWPQTMLLTLYVVWACLSSFLFAPSTHDLNGRLVVKDLLVRWFTVMAITQLVVTEEDREKTLRLLVVSAAVLVILSLGKLAFTGTNWKEHDIPSWLTGTVLMRANAPGVHTDELACELVMIFPLTFSYLLIRGKTAWKTFNSILVPFLVLTVVLTYSRTGFLVLGVAVVGIFSYGRDWGKALVIVAVGLTIAMLAPPSFWERMATIATDREGSNRIFLYTAAVRMIKESPLLGVGYGGFQHLVNNYYPLYSSTIAGTPHNIYLELWSETGILGLFLYASLLGSTIIGLRRTRRSRTGFFADSGHSFALELSFLIFALAGLTTPLLLDPVFYAVLGVAISAILDSKSAHAQPHQLSSELEITEPR